MLSLGVVPIAAQAQFTFKTNNGAITITGYTGPGGAVSVPSTTNGYPVTCIGEGAFGNGQGRFSYISSLILPDTVTNIGNSSFYNCYGLTNASLGANLISIGTNAFRFCNGLTNLALPASVTDIGRGAFSACSKLAAISVDTNNPVYSSLAGVLVDKSQAALLQCPAARAGSYVVADTVRSIGDGAFDSCTLLSSISIPASVTNIGFEAFSGCIRLSTISVEPANPVYRSLEGVLFDQMGSTLLQCPIGKAGAYSVPPGVRLIGDEAFYNCTNLTGVALPEGVLSIGDGAFENCHKLATVSLPGSLTNLGNSAFFACLSLGPGVVLSDQVRSLGNFAFGYCVGLKSVAMSGVSNIGFGAFSFCTALTNVTLSPNLASLGVYAFNTCSSLEAITIPDSVSNIGNYAFFDCSKLANVNIPTNVTAIGVGVFEDCASLSHITLPANVFSVGYNAFMHCGLTNVSIPGSVTNLDGNAFCDCSHLESVFFQGNAPAVDSSSFLNDSGLTAYVLPGTLGWPAFTDSTTVPTVWWNAQPQGSDSTFGIESNRFGFAITGTTNIPIVIEACNNPGGAHWTPLLSCLLTNGEIYFSDPQWTNYPARFYRIRSP